MSIVIQTGKCKIIKHKAKKHCSQNRFKKKKREKMLSRIPKHKAHTQQDKISQVSGPGVSRSVSEEIISGRSVTRWEGITRGVTFRGQRLSSLVHSHLLI